MTPEQYRLLSESFAELAPLPKSRRQELINARFGGQPTLQREVEALLAEHDRVDAPVATARGLHAIDDEGLSTNGDAPFGRNSEPIPVLTGTYRLLRTIGEGGMGVVYEAEQAFPRRRVALKAIRHGLSSPGMLRRFRTEVELLARLQHPGITQIYEAGFADEGAADRAYFVMELVDGLPLNNAVKFRFESMRERLDLVVKLCDAVQHAHQRGVIHRDLKPSNILVTHAGQPKILDFGIARAADDPGDGTLMTRAGQVIGTPSYMSPEQMAGEPVDTRTDVYALGVIMYEVLTGNLPFDFSKVSIAEAARKLRDHTATPLSRVDRDLRGDLEVIVSTAMHLDRDRRYSSAAALAEDIRRFLDGRPIIARRDSALYVIGKIARRHWAIVSLGAVLLASIVAFAAYSTALASRNARLARDSDFARAAAVKESERNAALSRELESELLAARIDRGQAEAAAGKLKLAEDTLWKEYFETSQSSAARWALWEMYHRMPCLWTLNVRGTTHAAISSDGSIIALGFQPGAIELRHGNDGSLLARVNKLGAPVSSLALSPDATSLAVGLANGHIVTINVSHTPSAKPLSQQPPHAKNVSCLAFSADGTRLVAGGVDKKLTVWDASTGDLIQSWTTTTDQIFSLAVSRDASVIAVAGYAPTGGHAIYRNGVLDQSLSIPMPPFDQIRWMAFTPDDQSLYVARSSNDVGIYDLRTNRFDLICRDLSAMTLAAAPSKDASQIALGVGQHLLIAPLNQRDDLLKAPRNLGQQRDTIMRLGWTKEGRLLSVSDQGEIRCFDPHPEPGITRITGFRSWCFASAWSPDGSLLTLDGGGNELVTMRTGSFERLNTFEKPSRLRDRGMEFFSDSSRVLCSGLDGRLRILDARTGTLLQSWGERLPETYSLKIMPGERTAITGHWDGSMRLWNLETGQIIRELPKCAKRLDALALSPDGKILAGSSLNTGVQLWDAATFEPLRSFETSGSPWGVAFSPDGSSLAVTTYTGSLDVFDLATSTRRASITAHQRLAPALTYSPDGELLATGSEDGSIRIWDAKSLRQLMTLEPRSATIVHLAFHPSSRYLAAGSEGRAVVIYDLHAMDAAIEGNRPYQSERWAK